MSQGLASDKRRQANDSIRGYVYQVYQSVLAWMCLGKDEELFLEGAEDFDVHSGDGVTATQVKDTAGSGTLMLRSGDAVPPQLTVVIWPQPWPVEVFAWGDVLDV